MKITRITDRPAIERQLVSDPARNLYLLGDLNDYYFRNCEYYFVESRDGIESVILVYRSWGTTLVPTGSVDGLNCFLDSHSDLLTDKFYAAWTEEYDSLMQSHFDIPEREDMYRMSVIGSDFEPTGVASGARQLSMSDLSAVRKLLESYPGNFFEEYQLDTGFYHGIFDGDRLISMAGVHTTNDSCRVAAIGNVVTDLGYRGQGLGTAVTSVVVAHLLESHTLIGLNVNRMNEPAVRSYKRLGFHVDFGFHEGFCYKK